MTLDIRAFLFDLDGVITDTAEFHYLSWKRVCEEEGIPFRGDIPVGMMVEVPSAAILADEFAQWLEDGCPADRLEALG